jgi:ketosteroid isomerase-like protein
MTENEALLIKFYSAFQRLDAETMAACYADEMQFSDPVFPALMGAQAADMWRMLCSKAQDFSLVFDDIVANQEEGKAHWVATYTFSQTGRKVVNDIHARFRFKDGKIVQHQDTFDLWRWSRQALGLKGMLLGWTPLVHKAVQVQAAKSLAIFSAKQSKM